MDLITHSGNPQKQTLFNQKLSVIDIPISELIRENEEPWQYNNLTESYSPDTTTIN